MAATSSTSTNLAIGVLPEYDSRKDPPLYNELTRLRAGIRNLAAALDQYTGASAISVAQFSNGYVPFGSSSGLTANSTLAYNDSTHTLSTSNLTLTQNIQAATGTITTLGSTTGTITTLGSTNGTITTLGATTGTITTLGATTFSTGTFKSTATTLGFYSIAASPIVQPTTSVAAATFVAGAGTAVNDASTFDGYTIKQIVKALRSLGLLA